MTVDVDEGVEHKQGGQVAVVEEGVAKNKNIHTIRAMKCESLGSTRTQISCDE